MTLPAAGLGGLDQRWSPTVGLSDLELTRRTNHRYGTISRYRGTTDDGIERAVIHGQSIHRLSVSRRSPEAVHLTIGTAPPLSLGTEGLVMHSLLRSMESGVDGIVFGPERSPTSVRDVDEARALAREMTFPKCARVSHLVCDHLSRTTSTDLEHMLWTGVSLGAMKGIAFAAFAPMHGRKMVFSQFVVPACPYPRALPTDDELRRFTHDEFGALIRLSAELLAHDLRKRMFTLNQNVARAMRPGLVVRYARSAPRDSVSNLFTEGWRDAVVSGDAGVAATRLPADRLATFELFDDDEGGPCDEWSRRLDGKLGNAIRIDVKPGRHTDALRLSNQMARARQVASLVQQIRDGVPVDELTHPRA